jgi:hypothetical protein
MSGKGSSPRPYSVDQKTFTDNWDRIFGPKKNSTETTGNLQHWDAYSDLPAPGAYQGDQNASKS